MSGIKNNHRPLKLTAREMGLLKTLLYCCVAGTPLGPRGEFDNISDKLTQAGAGHLLADQVVYRGSVTVEPGPRYRRAE